MNIMMYLHSGSLNRGCEALVRSATLIVKKAVPEMTVFASGGIKDGLDIAKSNALGATLGGMAGQFLKAAAISTEKTIEMMQLTKRQIEVTMFATGVEKLEDLKVGKLVKAS